MVARLRRLASSARLQWPLTLNEIRAYKKREKSQELAKWASLGSQGKSVAALTDDRIGNRWLYEPTLLKPCRLLTALRMRTNTCSDKAAMNRAEPQVDVMCRQCGSQIETLGHILGQCTSTKPARIHRHNEICDLVVEQLRKQSGVAVTREPTVRGPLGGNLKPDLVIQSGGRVHVVDVTVRHEDGDYLARGRDDKIHKYSRLLPILQRDLGVTAGEVLPIVVGTRGAMPKETVKALAKLGIKDRGVLSTMSLIALRSSIEMYHTFMDYNAPPRRGVWPRPRPP